MYSNKKENHMTNSQTQIEEFTIAMDHFFAMQQELGVSTVWSMYDMGPQGSDFAIFNKKMRKVTYTFVRPDATSEELYNDLKNGTNTAMAQTSAWAMDGTIKNLWIAADSCIEQSGTHHRYIEDFVVQENGSLDLVTGS